MYVVIGSPCHLPNEVSSLHRCMILNQHKRKCEQLLLKCEASGAAGGTE